MDEMEVPGEGRTIMRIAALMTSAESMRSESRFSAAEMLYRQVLDMDPSHAPAWSGLAQMAMTNRSFELAAFLFIVGECRINGIYLKKLCFKNKGSDPYHKL